MLKIYDSKTRKIQVFKPLDKKNIKMYVCGPTVYDLIHIGNGRPIVVFDVLYRILRRLYGGKCVTYVRNITDVDDKIINKACADNISIDELTKKNITQFHQDVEMLGSLPPTVEPLATDHIDDMITMIQDLIDKNHAYVNEGNVLFSVKSWQQYGKFANKDNNSVRAGARVKVEGYKKDPQDFILWKTAIKALGDDAGDSVNGAGATLQQNSCGGTSPYKSKKPYESEVSCGWNSPWGFGRPGWHIECSAMAKKYLGADFDIHAGGIDLLFPHHQNEIAQSCCANQGSNFATYWMHNGYVLSGNQKMSKSLGNFHTVKDLLNLGGEQHSGIDEKIIAGLAIRLVLLSTHYLKPLDCKKNKIKEAREKIKQIFKTLKDNIHLKPKCNTGKVENPVLVALCEDLNTPLALSEVWKLQNTLKTNPNEQTYSAFEDGLNLLGLLPSKLPKQDCKGEKTDLVLDKTITNLMNQRTAAKAKGDYELADAIRAQVKKLGYELIDDSSGKSTYNIL